MTENTTEVKSEELLDKRSAVTMIVMTSKKQRYIKYVAAVLIAIMSIFVYKAAFVLTVVGFAAAAGLMYLSRNEEMYEKYLIDKYKLIMNRW